MTSPQNDAATRAFFEQHAYFGLEPGRVFFFPQNMLPALDLEGRIPPAARDLPRAERSRRDARGPRLLRRARRRSPPRHPRLQLLQVDNPLARPTDPLFLGLHSLEEACMSSKVVDKRDAAEKVGVIGRLDGTLGCIEYSDLPDARVTRSTRPVSSSSAPGTSRCTFRLGFVDDLTRGGLRLPWHLARKKMNVVGLRGKGRGDRREVRDVRLRRAPRAERSLTLEVDARSSSARSRTPRVKTLPQARTRT
jgi:UDP-N-acetylglucosamine/UDP-N-acetylgalactosamine diphosphorylase